MSGYFIDTCDIHPREDSTAARHPIGLIEYSSPSVFPSLFNFTYTSLTSVAQWGPWSPGIYGVVSLDQTPFDGILPFKFWCDGGAFRHPAVSIGQRVESPHLVEDTGIIYPVTYTVPGSITSST